MASISGFGLLEFFSCCRLQTVLFSGLSGCGLFSTVVSVAVDCRQFCLNGLSGCGPWVPFVTGLSGSRTSCVIASVAMEQFCSVISVEDLTLLGPLAAAVAVDLWVYFIILCGCWTGVSVNQFLYVFLQMFFIMVFGRKSYTCSTRGSTSSLNLFQLLCYLAGLLLLLQSMLGLFFTMEKVGYQQTWN